MTELCLVAIARDEARCIARCLESAKPLVDRMLVLDTGSTDNTPEQALALGASVHHYTWQNDFAAARNRALELASAPWVLVLDADEWVPDSIPGAHTLRAHMAQHAEQAGLIRVRSDIVCSGQTQVADTWLPRLLPGDTRYTGRIHEQPVTRRPDRRVDFTVLHDGYSASEQSRKRQRNAALLERAAAERPLDPYIQFQLGVEADAADQWESACFFYEKAEELSHKRAAPYRHALAYRRIHALCRAGRLQDALAVGVAATEQWADSADVHFAFGNACLDAAVADPSNALNTWLPAAEAAWIRCLEIGEHSPYNDHLRGRGGHLAAHNLAVIYAGTGQHGLADRYRRMAEQKN